MNLIDYVNIDFGTDSNYRESKGNTLPYIQLPFAAIGVVNQTDKKNKEWFYNPNVNYTEGIRFCTQPSPWLKDLGHITIMPFTGKDNFHDLHSSVRDKVQNPCYLSMYLQRFRLNLELTLTNHGCIFKVESDKEDLKIHVETFGEKCEYEYSEYELKLVTNKPHDMELYANFEKYYLFSFEQKIQEVNTHINENGCVELIIVFASKSLRYSIMSSLISLEQTKLNKIKEVDDFQTILTRNNEIWNQHLSTITFDNKDKELFYTIFYRCFCFPHKISEKDENNEDIFKNLITGEIVKSPMYSDIGFWDVYRTNMPLLKKILPARYKQIINSCVTFYEQYEWLPRWIAPVERGIMPATLIDVTLSDAIINEIVNEDKIDSAIKGLLKNSYQVGINKFEGREYLNEYIKYGYIPYDIANESVTTSLDYYYSDYCISKALEHVGGYNKEVEELYNRSQKFSLIFNKENNFFQAKDSNGNFKIDFDPYTWGDDYCESSAWANNFNMVFNFKKLEELFGSKHKIISRLDEIFNNESRFNVGKYGFEIHEMTEMVINKNLGQFAISNQPSFVLPFIYLLYNENDKFSNVINKTHEYFKKGYPGDEDNGSLSAWYIFTCIGEYPLNILEDNIKFEKKMDNLEINKLEIIT